MPLTKKQIKERFFGTEDDEDGQLDACVDDIYMIQAKALAHGRAGETFSDPEDFRFAIGMEIDAVANHGDIEYEDVKALYLEVVAEGVILAKKDAAAIAAAAAVAALPKGATRAKRAEAGAAAAQILLTPTKTKGTKKGNASPAAPTTKGKGRKAA